MSMEISETKDANGKSVKTYILMCSPREADRFVRECDKFRVKMVKKYLVSGTSCNIARVMLAHYNEGASDRAVIKFEAKEQENKV
jgi:hypothetical protein